MSTHYMEMHPIEDRRRTVVPAPNNLPYVVAVVMMMTLGVSAAIAIIVTQAMSPLLLIGAIFGFIAPTTLSLLAFMKAQETHLSVNSRLDAFISSSKQSAYGQGLEAGRAAAENRSDVLTAAAAAAASGVPKS